MDLFHTLIYLPIHNLLVFFVDAIPGGDLGLAVIGATVVVKLVLLPLSLQAARTQRMMRAIEPELKELREKYKDDKEKQAKEMFALYKDRKIKPFASILMLFIQLPIIFGLYFVSQGAASTVLDPSLLYPFIPLPEDVNLLFLGIFSVTTMSITLAIVAGVAQFLQVSNTRHHAGRVCTRNGRTGTLHAPYRDGSLCTYLRRNCSVLCSLQPLYDRAGSVGA
jgi:YidC/Oxa1 family membrane protein insertase